MDLALAIRSSSLEELICPAIAPLGATDGGATAGTATVESGSTVVDAG
jgi:hypothetical protein